MTGGILEAVLFWVFLVIGALAWMGYFVAWAPGVAWTGRLMWACVFVCLFVLGLKVMPFH